MIKTPTAGFMQPKRNVEICRQNRWGRCKLYLSVAITLEIRFTIHWDTVKRQLIKHVSALIIPGTYMASGKTQSYQNKSLEAAVRGSSW